MREPEIALVFTPEPWVEALHRHLTDHGGARVRQVVVDPALVLEEVYETLVVSHRWPALSRALVDDVHARGRRVLGVHDREEPESQRLLADVGVDAVVACDAHPRDVLAALADLGPESAPTTDPIDRRPVATTPRSRGRVIAVGGAAGAGRTEVAIALARSLAELGHVALVDGDEVAPSIAPRLGLPVEPNLRTAVDAVEHGTGRLDECCSVVDGVSVVAGIPNTSTWSQLRPDEVLRLLRRMSGDHRYVVVDCAPSLDDVPGRGRGRYAVTRALVCEADSVVAVGTGAPVGATRVLLWLADAHALAPNAPFHVVLNRAPSDRFRRGELLDEISRTFPPSSLTFVPSDRRVTAAAWDGRPVPRGAFARAVGDLAARVDRFRGALHQTDARAEASA